MVKLGQVWSSMVKYGQTWSNSDSNSNSDCSQNNQNHQIQMWLNHLLPFASKSKWVGEPDFWLGLLKRLENLGQTWANVDKNGQTQTWQNLVKYGQALISLSKPSWIFPSYRGLVLYTAQSNMYPNCQQTHQLICACFCVISSCANWHTTTFNWFISGGWHRPGSSSALRDSRLSILVSPITNHQTPNTNHHHPASSSALQDSRLSILYHQSPITITLVHHQQFAITG